MIKEESLSLVDFHAELQQFRRKMKQVSDKTAIAFLLFDEDEEIFAEQCDQVKNVLHTGRDPIREFYQLLRISSRLPITIVPFSFSLLTLLRQANDLLDELLVLIMLFRRICRTSSRDMIERRREIKYKLNQLLRIYEDILQQIDHLLLKVLTQERTERQKLKSISYSSL